MKPIFFRTALLMAAIAMLGLSTAATAQSGGVVLGNSIIEPAIEDMTGNPVFILETQKSPFPVKSNASAAAPIYAVLYPLASSVPAGDLDCQPTNCNHDQVFEMPNTDYGILPASLCQQFTPDHGSDCSALKGLDILLGLARTGGDFSVPRHMEFVYFTHKAFTDGAIDTRVKLLTQLQSLQNNGDVMIFDIPITFDCAPVPEQAYGRGTPEVIPYP